MNRPLTLVSSVVGAVVVALDGTVLTVAQPTLQRELHASFAEVQWTSTAYLIAVASLLVFAGRLGDRYGQRRMFAWGMLGFGTASAAIGLAPGVGWVIALRAAQGVFGALLQPATLGMLRTAFPPDRLAMPLAVRTAAIGLAAAAGPVVGGALVTELGWRAVFFLNVLPSCGFGALALAARDTGGARPAGARLDVPGALLLAVTLGSLVHALVLRPASAQTVAGLSLAAVAGAAFVRHERRTAYPLLPPEVIGSRAVGAALGVLVAASASLFGTLFAVTYVLQDGLGLDPFHSALRSLPLAVLMVLSAPGCAVLLRRVGARRTTGAAMAVLAAGVLVLSRASGTLALGAGFALLGAGFGTVMVAATHVVVRQADAGTAGVAGGLQQTALNIGPTLGVAAATSLLGAGTTPALTVLAAVAALGAVACRALPGHRVASITPRPDPRGRAGVPATMSPDDVGRDPTTSDRV
ncbi:MFS transporter [Streptomyces sp. NPDC001480]|uniref:MFS transporter n=1 Tax=Streptomyces sp. NPDC001480 TaxID=3364577 RepID=UPI003685739C